MLPRSDSTESKARSEIHVSPRDIFDAKGYSKSAFAVRELPGAGLEIVEAVLGEFCDCNTDVCHGVIHGGSHQVEDAVDRLPEPKFTNRSVYNRLVGGILHRESATWSCKTHNQAIRVPDSEAPTCMKNWMPTPYCQR